MHQYLALCNHVLNYGKHREDRTGTGTWSTFGYMTRYDLSKGFPLLTTKKLNWNNIVYELFWFLRGDTNINYLHENNVHIWDEWADGNGNLGPIYGQQWRSWPMSDGSTLDQIQWVMNEIRKNPTSRRLIVSAWNAGQLNQMKLPPCHLLFQFYVDEGKLSCMLTQRSGDVFLGIPYNIASYALLTHIIAAYCSLKVGEFIHVIGDVHIYLNHLSQVHQQIKRSPYPLPTLTVLPDKNNMDLKNMEKENIILENYIAWPHIKGDVSV